MEVILLSRRLRWLHWFLDNYGLKQIKGIVIFRTADYADDADFTQIEFLDAQAHELTQMGWRKIIIYS